MEKSVESTEQFSNNLAFEMSMENERVNVDGKNLDSSNVSLTDFEYIDKKYDQLKYQTLRNKLMPDLKEVIKMEVGKAVEENTKLIFLRDEHITTRSGQRKGISNIESELVTSLQCEINFLREEIREKNSLIKLLTTKSLMQNDHNSAHGRDHLINVENNIKNCNNENSLEMLKPISPTPPNFDFPTPQTSPLKVESVNRQLMSYRSQQHENFEKAKATPKELSKPNIYINKSIVVLGDSILNGVEEKISRCDESVEIKFHSGAKIRDMYEHVKPIVLKKPDALILHVGTNDAKDMASNEIIDGILSLKRHVEKKLPTCKVIISSLTPRTDDGKAQFTIRRFNDHLNQLKVQVMNNSNITVRDLGKKGLHLSRGGKGKLARNIVKEVEQLNER